MRPQYTTRDEVPADVVEKERRIAEQITRDEGKPEQAIGKIVEGRLNALLQGRRADRAGVREGPEDRRSSRSWRENGVTVTGFARFQVGQA